ncbi:MAG: 1-(5-phosphoribosyl)-5-((5-phosphoribosylamino)methylideneamino)imidazole-4-carboxamide isomerase, partial [Candidatus Heimdallarchaeota archaeon]|nr:1-(5-phosphoribosyl)-5-((5-phosphoribosylamino)methylideneamino)imidazole-4-carboxamide isomerase [Candidatus Heimdallarchaeota archaeon]
MIIIPAIDLRNGKVVRLLRGEYDKETVYGDNPIMVARTWKESGAEIIHIVNLDGA